jgi:hypothetical protein
MEIKFIGVSELMKVLHINLDKEESKQKESIVKSLLHALVEATPIKTGAARRAWKMHKTPSGNIYLVNDKKYIRKLNAGSSKQAPAHFIEQTVLNNNNVKVVGTIVKYE